MGLTINTIPGCKKVTVVWTNKDGTVSTALDRGNTPLTSRNNPPGSMSYPDTPLSRGTYTYFATDRDNNNVTTTVHAPGSPDPSCTTHWSGYLIRASSLVTVPEAAVFETMAPEQVTELARTLAIQSLQGDFVLQVPQRAFVQEFRHHQPGDITDGNWQLIHTLKLPPNDGVQDTSITLIQNLAGRFEAIVRATSLQGGGDDFLVGYELNEGSEWQGPVPLIADDGPINHVTGSQAFIRSDYGQEGFFELLVVRGSTFEIEHFQHTRDTILKENWHLVAKLSFSSNQVRAIAISLNQSSSGKLEAIVRFTDLQDHGPDFLAGYEFDGSTWQGPVPLASDDGPINRVSGSQALFQNDQNTFELVVPIAGSHSGEADSIHHYRLDEEESFLKGTWRLVAKLPPLNNDNRIHPISLSLTQNAVSNLELVAREKSQQGQVKDVMVGYVFSQDSGWSSPSVLQSDQGPITVSDSEVPLSSL